MMLEMLPAGAPATLAWAVLLHDVGKPPTFRSAEETGDRIRFDGHAEIGARMAAEICRRLRFSTDDTEQIESLVANHLRFKDVFGMRPGHAQAVRAPARISTSTWNCTASTAPRATASWTPTNSYASSCAKRRRSRSGRHAWLPETIWRKWGFGPGRNSRKSSKVSKKHNWRGG